MAGFEVTTHGRFWVTAEGGIGDEQPTAQSKFVAAMSVGQESVVTNPLESRQQGMEEKPADELIGAQFHVANAVAVLVVLPLKGDIAILDRMQTLITDCHSMRIAGQIVADVLGSSEWPLGVGDSTGNAGASPAWTARPEPKRDIRCGSEVQSFRQIPVRAKRGNHRSWIMSLRADTRRHRRRYAFFSLKRQA